MDGYFFPQEAPSPVLTPEQQTSLAMGIREMSALTPMENIAAGLAYVSKSRAELMSGPGWDVFVKAAEKAERFLAEHGQD